MIPASQLVGFSTWCFSCVSFLIEIELVLVAQKTQMLVATNSKGQVILYRVMGGGFVALGLFAFTSVNFGALL